MCHLPHLSHVFRLLPGAVPGMAAARSGPRRGRGNPRPRQPGLGMFERCGLCGSASWPSGRDGTPHPVSPGSKAHSGPMDPTGSTGPVDPSVPPNEEYRLGLNTKNPRSADEKDHHPAGAGCPVATPWHGLPGSGARDLSSSTPAIPTTAPMRTPTASATKSAGTRNRPPAYDISTTAPPVRTGSARASRSHRSGRSPPRRRRDRPERLYSPASPAGWRRIRRPGTPRTGLEHL